MEPPTVRRPVMYQHWLHLTFLHWRYPADVVQALLPAGLRAQEFDGSAWIGLVLFLMDRVRAPGVPALPWLSRFPETNVRTYVTAPDGTEGIWFFSLDATRLPAVLAGRSTYRLPYQWASMSVGVAADSYRYRGSRRWPGPRGARCDAVVERGAPVDAGPRERFLTYRFRLYSLIAGRLVTALAEHPPWSLHTGRACELDETLTAAAGLPVPDGEPLVHTSPGVAVKIGMWRPLDGAR
jgi:uncharacterized protein YqjF (DUF2071 family)